MTRYEEFCAAYFAVESRRSAINGAFRQIPGNMRQGFSEYLDVPRRGATVAAVIAGGREISYVDLYKKCGIGNGERDWTPCPPGEELQFDPDGKAHFTIGIFLEKHRGAMPASFVILPFSIEVIGEQSAELQFNAGDRVIVSNHADPSSYVDAAGFVMRLLLDKLRGPATTRALRAFVPIETRQAS